MTLIWLVVALALCIPLLGLIVDSPIGRALGVRLERGNARDPAAEKDLAGLQAQVQLLEHEVDELRKEVGRLREEHEFSTRLLQRDASSPSLPPTRE